MFGMWKLPKLPQPPTPLQVEKIARLRVMANRRDRAERILIALIRAGNDAPPEVLVNRAYHLADLLTSLAE